MLITIVLKWIKKIVSAIIELFIKYWRIGTIVILSILLALSYNKNTDLEVELGEAGVEYRSLKDKNFQIKKTNEELSKSIRIQNAAILKLKEENEKQEERVREANNRVAELENELSSDLTDIMMDDIGDSAEEAIQYLKRKGKIIAKDGDENDSE